MGSHLSEKINELWDVGWEIRAMVILSLSLQIFLVFYGNRKRYEAGKWLRNFVWLAYVSADWVAITALGILARSQGDNTETNPNSNQSLIPAFWAPILLVHLGGPDTITAYQMEDNELWLRHLLTLAAQASLTTYFLFVSWRKDTLTFIGVAVLVSGCIKYGERVWAFWHASSEKFRGSAFQEVTSSVQKFDDLFTSNGMQLLLLSNASIDAELNNMIDDLLGCNATTIPEEAIILHEARLLFPTMKILFADLPLIFPQHVASYKMLKKKDALEAFKLIEIGLGIMHDTLYTKVTRASLPGIFLHSISFLSSIFALSAFTMNLNKHRYSKTDTIISQLLLVGAIFLEIYSIIMLLILSDLVMLSTTKANTSLANSIFRAISSSRLTLFPSNIIDKRWSRSMAQRNLLDDVCSSRQYIIGRLQDPCCPDNGGSGFSPAMLTWKEVDFHLKEMIFRQLLHKRSRYDPGKNDYTAVLEKLLAERGERALEERQCLENFGWSIADIGFDHSLIIWHVATDLCYHDDLDKVRHVSNLHSNCKTSKLLADYLLYLIVSCPSMMPKGFGETRYGLTFMGALLSLVHLEDPIQMRRTKASRALFRKYCSGSMGSAPQVPDVVLYPIIDCCKLAKSLQLLEIADGWTHERKWEMICEVWVEMLAHAASHCGWKQHAQRLNQGGELLTHLYLLMALLGLNEQCRGEVFILPPPIFRHFWRGASSTIQGYVEEEIKNEGAIAPQDKKKIQFRFSNFYTFSNST